VDGKIFCKNASPLVTLESVEGQVQAVDFQNMDVFSRTVSCNNAGTSFVIQSCISPKERVFYCGHIV
jgi:hypothetical protein